MHPNRRQLRISHTPLIAGRGASEVRWLVIARLGRLAVFNGSGIGARERRDAEKAYLCAVVREIKARREADSLGVHTAAGSGDQTLVVTLI